MKKNKENTEPKDPVKQGEGIQSSLFQEEIPVWYDRRGKVCSKWTSRCEEERKQTMNVLEEIASLGNLIRAYRAVKKNRGSAGVDGVTVKEFGEWLNKNHKDYIAEILSGRYKPSLVRGVEIPKPKGGKRLLGIPTVRDRVLQQAISQVMTRYYDVTFTESSHGFRPKRGTRGALKEAEAHIKGGKTRIVDIDLEKFFDEVNQSRLMWQLSLRIGDRRLLDLIRKLLRSGILIGGVENQRMKGTPQGSPLSPLLSNIVLDELDQELTRRGLSFVRYADDMLIFTSSQKSAERVYKGVSEFIRNKMRLKVNETKSGIRKLNEVNFLGHGFMGKGKLRLSESSETKFKEKLKKATSRNRGISLEQMIKEVNAITRGWLNYFKGALMKSKLEKINSWLKRRIRCFRLKQCKRVIGIVRLLRRLKVGEKLSWKTALSGKSWWRLSNSPGTNIGMNNKWFEQMGYYDLVANYDLLHKSA
jgi:group II intron reverse transcriptase/maturase